MNSQSFINVNNNYSNNTQQPFVVKEKLMSYEEKSVGSTSFFKCEACPFMALAEDDIKFHLFTVHPDLAKRNGLADNVKIACPGCSDVFDTEETLRNHLKYFHKMGIKDIRKMVKSLVQIALKDAKLKKENDSPIEPAATPTIQENADLKVPPIIEIVPHANINTNSLPKGVAFISVDELNKMSTPNFENVNAKEIIQEASINIVYTNEVSTQYAGVPATSTASNANMTNVTNVPPDLISSIKPKTKTPLEEIPIAPMPLTLNPDKLRKNQHQKSKMLDLKEAEIEKKLGKMCSFKNCSLRMHNEEKLLLHTKCHKDAQYQCTECGDMYRTTETLHVHLWKVHSIDLELPTCEICGYKTYQRHRLNNIHMKQHGNVRAYKCPICSKAFKSSNHLSKHKLIHKKDPEPAVCNICQRTFRNQKHLKGHVATVHNKIRPFKCNECEYSCARKDQMTVHTRSHTGDKPYMCTVCQFRTGDHNSLRRHKMLHTNDHVYKCKHCPYTAIQSTQFTSHMISKHPNITTDLHRCPYCPFKTINKNKYVIHLTSHTDKEGISVLIELMKESNASKPNWTIPSETEKGNDAKQEKPREENEIPNGKPLNDIPIEVYDCDSLSESMPQDYSKNACPTTTNDCAPSDYGNQIATDLSKDSTDSSYVVSGNSEDPIDRRQFSQHSLPPPYDTNQTALIGFLNPVVTMEQDMVPNTHINSLASSHSPIPSSINNNIMANFPIRLPTVPQLSILNNITLKPVDKIFMPMNKAIIKPSQILPVSSSSSSPVNTSFEPEGVPRKKPKISVKSNLILKGPDPENNMFHSQQKMAFKRLEDNERFGLGGRVTFNNLITTQLMQLQAEPTLSESPNNIMSYPQDAMLGDASTTPVESELSDSPQIFSFNQQMNVNQMTLLPPAQKIPATDPSYIKIEAPIKQNTQSPSLERMCNANILNNQAITREYKASPPLEDIHKNISEVKNELKSDAYYTLALNNSTANPSVLDQYLMDNLIGEQYSGHLDLSTVVLPEVSGDEEQNDVIEIDDNSDDHKLLPRFDMNFPLESLYLMHNDFHFLDNDVIGNNNLMNNDLTANDMSRLVVNESPVINEISSVDTAPDVVNSESVHSMQGKKDPMMNTSVRTVNKINVKNIELMKN